MYEQRDLPPIPRAEFYRRLAMHFALSSTIIGGSLFVGMIGYHSFEGLGWCDCFLNSAMLLGGMGPVNTPVTQAGKLFAGFYALYAGLVFLIAAGIIVAPVVHRILHRFHWDEDAEEEGHK